MKIISFGVLVMGILFIRKIAWGYISRRLQYSLWILPALFLIFVPFFHLPCEFSVENILFSVRKKAVVLVDTFEMQNNKNTQIEIGTKRNRKIFLDTKIVKMEKDSDRIGEIFSYIQNPQGLDQKHGMVQMQELEGYQEQRIDLGQELEGYQRQEKDQGKTVMIQKWMDCVKYMGTILIFGVLIGINIRFWLFCKKNRIFYKKDEQTNLDIYLLDGISTPFLFGNRIYVNLDMVEDEMCLHHVVLHEFCHLKHRDLLWIVVSYICLAFYWYNPFVWVALEYRKRDCELACDEAVMELLEQSEWKAYGYTLLSILKRQQGGIFYPMITTNIGGNWKKMKERIVLIAAGNRKSSFFTCGVIFLIFLLVVATFTRGNGNRSILLTEWEEDLSFPSMDEVETIKIRFHGGIYSFSTDYNQSLYEYFSQVRVKETPIRQEENREQTLGILIMFEEDLGTLHLNQDCTEIWYQNGEESSYLYQTEEPDRIWEFIRNKCESTRYMEMVEADSLGEIAITPAVVTEDTIVGANGVKLDYADYEMIIFHDWCGLFVYSLKEQRIIEGIDLASIGCDATQGDNYCIIKVAADASKVYMNPYAKNELYIYDRKEGKLTKEEYVTFLYKDIAFFENLHSTSEKIGVKLNVDYSSECVKFTGFSQVTYAYLESESGMFSDLYYVKGSTRIRLFDTLPETTRTKWDGI